MPSPKKYVSLLPEFIQKIYLSYKNKYQLSYWNKQGRSIPVPHVVKQNIVLKYKNMYDIDILFETGTYLGDMVWAQRNNFDKIYSIELDKLLAESAKKRFRRDKNITIFQGDSGKILPKIVSSINEKTIFWLDAHYAGGITARGEKDCPVYEELRGILSTNLEHVILIDDARYFIGERDYPTIEGVSSFVLKFFPNSNISFENDCICIELKL